MDHDTRPPSSDPDDDRDDYPVATLWLPDPAARRGWETHLVWRKEPPKKRTTGFRTHKH